MTHVPTHHSRLPDPNANCPPGITRRDLLRGGGALAALWLLDHTLAGRVAQAAANVEARLSVTRAAESPAVALAQATRYDRAEIERTVFDMLDQLGGLGDVVRPGDRVAIKTNLTGGTQVVNPSGVPAVESYVTHPDVLRALLAAVRDAGAGEIFIVEAVYERRSWAAWGHTRVADEFGAELIDLNRPDPYADFIEKPVGDDWLVYDTLLFNPVLDDVDVFMSVAKMKCHQLAGITLAMKNLVGLVPAQFYALYPGHNFRSAMHGPGRQAMTRLPGVIMDLVRARPIDFALIDGVRSSESGEGPWNEGWRPVRPGMLLAGKNPVATDAVGAAAMGFDPAAPSLVQDPFRFSVNHLELARTLGLGPTALDHITITGAALDDVRVRFRPWGADRPAITGLEDHETLPYGGVI